jgi:partitioning defective protein 6
VPPTILSSMSTGAANTNSNTSNQLFASHLQSPPPPSFLEVKSKYDAEFRRIGLVRHQFAKFEEFYQLLERLHGLYGIQFNIYYTDKDGDLLPINNDNNFSRVQQVTVGVLRLIILRKGECYPDLGALNSASNFNTTSHSMSSNMNYSTGGGSNSSYRVTNIFKELSNPFGSHHSHLSGSGGNKPFQISFPEDFRPVSAIIDVDILPESQRRVRLHKHKSSKPLGFYIRDGRSLRVTPTGVEQVPGIFISRLMPGGLAESTGLLSVNDEVIEVNGIEVAGKTLDQVTDMMVANSSNLIITVKPTNQKYNLNKSNQLNSTSTHSNNSSMNSTNTHTNMKNMHMINNHSNTKNINNR